MADKVPVPGSDLVEALTARVARLEAEATLTGDRGFNRALLESMADGVVACDAQGVLTLFNRAAREWHGADPLRLPPEEWPRHYDLYQADGTTPLPAEEVPLVRAFRGEAVVDAGMAIVAKGRPVRFVLANGGPIQDEAGQRLGAVVVMRDVTALRRAEAELRRANDVLEARVEERKAEVERQMLTLRGIIDGVDAPIFSVDRDYRYTSFNQRHAAVMKALYGVEVGLGRSLLDCMTVPGDRAAARRNLDRALAGETLVEEAFSGDAPGTRHFFSVSHSPLRGGSQEVIGVVVLAQDLTDRKRAEEALRESERRYRDVFNSALDGIYLLEVLGDGRFRTIEVNPALERVTGIPRTASVGRTQEEIVPADVARIVNEKYQRCVDVGQPVDEEAVLDLPSGRRFFHSSLIPTRGDDGRVHRIVGISRDETDRKRHEAVNAARLHLMQFAVSHPLGEFLEEAINQAEALSGSRIGFFHFVGEDQRSLRLQDWSTATKERFCTAEGKGRHYPISEAGVWVDCVHQRRPVIHNDYASLPHRRGMPAGHAEVVRELVVPVLRGEKLKAILGVGNKAGDYADEDVKAVSLVAELAWEICERKLAEQELARVNRALRMLSESNQALLRTNDEAALLAQVCRIAVEMGGYRMAWVGYAGADGAATLLPMACAGCGPGEGAREGGPGGEAVRSGQPFVAQHLGDVPASAPWQEEARRRGLASVLALPLTRDAHTFGALEIYSAEQDAFEAGEIAVLSELAGDLAFGIAALRTRAKREEAEQELKRSEAKYRDLIERIQAAVVVHGPDTRIVTSNALARGLLGLTEAQMQGRAATDPGWRFLREDGTALPAAEYPVNQVLTTREALRDRVFGVRRGTEHDAWVLVNADPLLGADGQVAQVIVTFIDITERRRLEEQLRQSQKMEAIGTLAGGVAHDFNNVLTAVIGYANLAKESLQADDPVQASLDQILASSDRAAQLTHGLLAFSRKQLINPRPVDLNEVVRNIEKLLQRLIGEDIELSTSLAARELVAMADAGQIGQVLMNLAANARDAMPEGGLLSIATSTIEVDPAWAAAKGLARPGRCALVTISDTGSGMDERTRARLFEPFFTTKEMGKGTGLGLAIVYGIVKQHGGTIDAYSEPGRGTTFKLAFPLVAAALGEERPEASAPPPGGTEALLVAEDDPAVRVLTTTVLRRAGYRVIEATDGQDALEQFAAHRDEVDLLVLDVVMPKRSGREVCDAVRAQRPGLRALFVSGYTADILQRKGIFEEGLDFISKPSSPSELLRKVRALLDAEGGAGRGTGGR